MSGVPSGPCLPHCYSCPKTVVYASNVAIVTCVAFVVLIFGMGRLDEHFKTTISTTDMMQKYRCMQRQRWGYIIVGLICGGLGIHLYKPYTLYKVL